MPTGKEIVTQILKHIHLHYAVAVPDFDEELDENLTTTNEAIATLKLQPGIPPRIKEFLDCLLEENLSSQFMNDPFFLANRVEIIDFASPDFIKRNRPFSYSDSSFGYLSLSKLLRAVPLSSISADHEGYRALIDFTGSALNIHGGTAKLTAFLNYLVANDINKGVLVCKSATIDTSLRIYSFLYFQTLVNGGKIDIDSNLAYSGSHAVTVAYAGRAYEQYFELYDIMNEVNHASEIVTRFLKVYHLLEYLVYRAELVKIEIKARVNRSFIREIHGLAGKGVPDKELPLLQKNFATIFATELTANDFALVLTPDQATFFQNYFDTQNYVGNNATIVSKLIYKIRNSIVHNKESEFHITTTNPDAYAVIIPPLIQLITKLERAVYRKVDMNFNLISYHSNAIQLY